MREPGFGIRAVCSLALFAVAADAHAQGRDWSKIEVKTQQVAPGIHMLQAAGGNIGVSAGEDGVFLVDDQYAPLTDKIKAAVAAIDARPVRFVLNTHWHGDHTGGNENLGKAGVLIVAHDNVRTRLAAGQVNELMGRTVEPAPKAALPVVTFNDTVTFHLNGEEIRAWHVPPAHTDGDAIVHFTKADVIHTGDLLFVGGYPVLDVPSGATITGWIGVLDDLLERIRPETKIIPGHGPLATQADVRAFRDMLVTVRSRVLPLVREGKSVEEVIGAKPLADLEERWGKGFVPTDSFLKAVHMSLTRDPGETADGRPAEPRTSQR
jgi:glyoxylase-like metal-dependent hydrolase (beta-lactamase superfamily II)